MSVLPLSASRGFVRNVFKPIFGAVSCRAVGIVLVLAAMGIARSNPANGQIPQSTNFPFAYDTMIAIADITDQEITNVCVYQVLSGQISIDEYDDCVGGFQEEREWFATAVSHSEAVAGPSIRSAGKRIPGASGGFAANATATFTPALSSSIPALPFLGNQLTVLSWIPSSFTGAVGTVAYEVGLARQSDCSLDEVYIQPNSGLPDAQYLTSLTGAQDYFHQLAGLTTKADVFANGCAPQVLGLHASNTVQSLGETSGGAAIAALLASAGVYVTVTDGTANTSKTTQVTSGANPGAFYAASLRKNGTMDLVETGLTDPANSKAATAVLLGNGDGTFQTPVYYDVSANSYATAAGFTVDDVTGDGVPDIVILNGTVGAFNGTVIPVTGTVTTLIGKGDGTFTVGPSSSLTWTDSLQVVTGVFKTGDVKDLLVGGTVLFGAGNGSFTQGPTNDCAGNGELLYRGGGRQRGGKPQEQRQARRGGLGAGICLHLLWQRRWDFQSGPATQGCRTICRWRSPTLMATAIRTFCWGRARGESFAEGGYDTPIPTFQILMGRGDGTFVDSRGIS